MPGSGSDDVGNIPELWIWSAIEEATGVDAYPMTIPEGTEPPFVMFGREQTERFRSLEGDEGTLGGTFAIQIYADSYREGKVLARQVAGAVHDFSGTVGTLTIDDAWLESESDGQPIYLDGRERPTYVVEMTVEVRWQE